MFKKILTVALLGIGACVATAPSAEAGIYYGRVAPVRRVAARAVLPPYPIVRPAARVVLPPYPVARGVIGAPVYSPWVGGYGYGYSAYYGSPIVYGSGVVVY